MIKIGIVDDEMPILEKVRKCIENIPEKRKIEVETFHGAEEFLRRIEQKERYDILFSDIEMQEIDGISFGKIIREKYHGIYLIFLTSYSEYAVDSYRIDAYQYILKQQMEERIPAVLMRLIVRIEKERECFRWIGTLNDRQKIYYRDIIYIRKVKGSKYVEYVTTEGIYRERIPLEQLIRNMEADEFLMVDRGYVVNIKYITGVKGNAIYLKNNERVTVSRARLMAVKEKISRNWRY